MTDTPKVGVVMVPVESNRPATVVPVDLGQTGVAYVESQLEKAGPLAALVAQQIIGQGSSFTALEKGETLESALQFRTGTFRPTAAIRKWFTDYIGVHWGANSQLIFEDPWMKSRDFERHPSKQPYFFIDRIPYYAPRGDDLYAAFRGGELQKRSFLFSIFVISPDVPLPQSGAEMGQDYAELLARNTQAVLASAYDHEGYVMWQR